MSIRITELDAITSLQSGDYIAVDNESTGTHKFDALNIGANIGQNIANTYSSSASYAIGQYCLYDNNLYKCTTTISTPEAWNSSHWIQVTVGEGLYEKVDKVSGKGLSTNDFTNEYKQKLGGIEAGAEVNVQADWTENDSSKDDYIKNKPGNATTSASGFMSASDKQKLDNIEAGAEVNVQPNWAEDDSSKDDYIKNKPTIDTALSASSDNAVRNSAITAGINQVQGNLDTEITNRQNAVSGEQLARENADSALDGRLDTVEETLPNKANINGSYEEMTVGSAEQLISTESIEDLELYTFRASGGGMDIGDRETDKLVGGTVAWNQLCKETGRTHNGVTSSFANGVWSFSGTSTDSYFNMSTSFDASDKPKGHKLLTSVKILMNPNNISFRNTGFLNGISGAVGSHATGGIIQIMSTSDSASFGVNCGATGVVLDGVTMEIICVDLTQMFGATIADAIYAMEQAESGSGIAWFKKYFPKPYYAYDAGSLQSVNVASHDMTGFNQWDEEWEAYGSSQIKSKNLIPLIAGATYYLKVPAGIGGTIYFKEDVNIPSSSSWSGANETFTVPSNIHYGIFYAGSGYGTTYNHDICINRVWTGNRNGEYEPYELHSYTYDESVELRGIPSLVDGELVYDGDTYEADGTVIRKYGIVDLGTVDWNYEPDYNRHGFDTRDLSLAMKIPSASDSPNVMMSEGKYNITSSNEGWAQRATLTSFAVDASGYARIYNDGTADATAFKTAMSGVYLVYELATPTSEQAIGFTNPQVVDAFGTEEYVDAGVKNGTRDVSIPVGHVTQYMANLRDKLQHLPNLVKEDGDYLVNQTGAQMKLKKVEGYYEDLVSGMADNLTTKIRENDQAPYLFRTSGGSVDIGDREYINGIVGGTVAWNQLCKDPSFETQLSVTSGTKSVSNRIATITANGDSNTYVIMGTELPTVANHIILLSCDVRLDANNSESYQYTTLLTSWQSGYTAVANAVNGVWKTMAGIVKPTAKPTAFAVYPFGTSDTLSGEKVDIKNPIYIDLTLMFGSTIADYIYSLEQATAGAGVAFFKSLFPKPYYAYNAGELMSVKGLVSHDMVGFNAWDEEWEVGVLNNGVPSAASNCIRSKNFCPCVGGATYYMTCGKTDGGSQNRYYIGIYWYDADKNYISFAYFNNLTGVAPSNARYFKISTNTSTVVYGNVYHNDICINLSWDGSEDGNYEPYEKHSYPLDTDLELRGIPKLDASNNLYYDGDVYEADGTVTRKYGVVDLGTLNWAYSGGSDVRFYSTGLINAKAVPNATVPNMMCGKLRAIKFDDFYANTTVDKTISYYTTGNYLFVRDLSTTNPATFKASVSGVYLVYELATPTTETADPYTSPQIVNDFGTEEFVIDNTIDVPIPVGHNTDYPINLKSKLEMAPDSPDGDGDYIVRQTNGTNEYVPLIIEDQLPAVPSTDGTYTLTVTIASGEATYSWT